MSWLLRDGDVLAALEQRPRGWPADLQGAVLIGSPTFVHTFGARAPIDVAWCSATRLEVGGPGLEVRRIKRVGRLRVGVPRIRKGSLVVAAAGSFERWRLQVGDRLEIREA